MAEAAHSNRYPFSGHGVLSALKEMAYNVILFRQWDAFVDGMMVLLLISIFFGYDGVIPKTESLMAIAGAIVILLYFTMRGRAISHIWISVALCAEFSIFESYALSAKTSRAKHIHMIKNIDGVAVFFGMVFYIFILIRSSWHIPEMALQSRQHNDMPSLEYTCHEEDLYIWENWHGNITQQYMNAGKLPTQEFLSHNISAGDWTYGQTYFENHLQAIHAENPGKALLERKSTYLVSVDYKDSLNFLRTHYGANITVKMVGKINGNPIWQFSKS